MFVFIRSWSRTRWSSFGWTWITTLRQKASSLRLLAGPFRYDLHLYHLFTLVWINLAIQDWNNFQWSWVTGGSTFVIFTFRSFRSRACISLPFFSTIPTVPTVPFSVLACHWALILRHRSCPSCPQGPVVPLDQSHVLCRSWLLPLSAKKKEVTKCH